MPVDITEDSIRIRIKDPDLFVQNSFRTITISEDQGIKAIIGKLKSDPDGSTVIQSYIFDKQKWTASEAEQWIKDHKKSKSSGIERRYVTEELQINYDYRLDNGDKVSLITGYAAVFHQKAELWPGFNEQIAPGAFANTILKDDIRALWNHDPNYVLGRNTAGTLKLSEDSKGLRYEIIPPDTSWAKDLQKTIKRKDVNQSSFGFNIIDEDVRHDKNSVTRTIKDVKLFDVSPVTFPAYPQTDVHVRMIAGENESIYLLEDRDEVIVLPAELGIPKPTVLSDEDLFKQFEELKKTAF